MLVSVMDALMDAESELGVVFNCLNVFSRVCFFFNVFGLFFFFL